MEHRRFAPKDPFKPSLQYSLQNIFLGKTIVVNHPPQLSSIPFPPLINDLPKPPTATNPYESKPPYHPSLQDLAYSPCVEQSPSERESSPRRSPVRPWSAVSTPPPHGVVPPSPRTGSKTSLSIQPESPVPVVLTPAPLPPAELIMSAESRRSSPNPSLLSYASSGHGSGKHFSVSGSSPTSALPEHVPKHTKSIPRPLGSPERTSLPDSLRSGEHHKSLSDNTADRYLENTLLDGPKKDDKEEPPRSFIDEMVAQSPIEAGPGSEEEKEGDIPDIPDSLPFAPSTVSSTTNIFTDAELVSTPSGCDDNTMFGVPSYALAFIMDTIPRQVYLYLLLWLPSLYYSRVSRIFIDSQLSVTEIDKCILDEAVERYMFNMPLWRPSARRRRHVDVWSPYDDLEESWKALTDSFMREWNTLNIISGLLLTAIITILQIGNAGKDPLIRHTALLSMICALMSLLYGCMYIIRFGTMQKTYKGAEWAYEADKPRTAIFWNVWVMLAMPATWLGWSILMFIVCIGSFIWRTGTTVDDNLSPHTPQQVISARVVVSFILAMGVVYFTLIVVTLREYGEAMDTAWMNRISGWVEVYYEHQRMQQAHVQVPIVEAPRPEMPVPVHVPTVEMSWLDRQPHWRPPSPVFMADPSPHRYSSGPRIPSYGRAATIISHGTPEPAGVVRPGSPPFPIYRQSSGDSTPPTNIHEYGFVYNQPPSRSASPPQTVTRRPSVVSVPSPVAFKGPLTSFPPIIPPSGYIRQSTPPIIISRSRHSSTRSMPEPMIPTNLSISRPMTDVPQPFYESISSPEPATISVPEQTVPGAEDTRSVSTTRRSISRESELIQRTPLSSSPSRDSETRAQDLIAAQPGDAGSMDSGKRSN